MNYVCTRGLFLSVLLVLFATVFSFGQTVSIATWKNDRKAAYSIIHDDYGDAVVDGIWQYGDTIAASRGIKFTIGAISSSCESSRNIKGYAGPYAYAKEVMIGMHGHEIIAHSHTHSCAVGGAGWDPCNSVGWADVADFSTEIDNCTNSIENGTDHRPQYYIYPYDRFNNSANDQLKSLGYIGSRSGWGSAAGESFYRNGYNANDLNTFYPDADGFFRTAVQVFDNSHTQMNNHELILNSAVDDAISNGEWANRELHNIGGTGWGTVSLDGYTKHLDYVQEKMLSGDLWVGTVSEILTYQLQKLKFDPQMSQTAPLTWEIEWDTINPQILVDFSSYFDNLNYTSALTMVVDLDARTGNWRITQRGAPVNYEIVDRIFHLDVFPHLGEITMELLNETFPAPNVVNPIPDQDLVGDFPVLTFDLNHVFEDSNSVDETLIYGVTGNTGIDIQIVDGVVTVTSQFGWEGIDTVLFSAEDESGAVGIDTVIFDVHGLNLPFHGSRFAIPTTIEAEDYDLGGELVAFLELDNYDISNYRSDSVDIKNDTGFTVVMENGEWMEYSITVDSSGVYDIDVFARSYGTGGAVNVVVDEELLRTFDVAYTDDSLQLTSNKLYNIELDSGEYVLNVEAKGKIEIDYLEISLPDANTPPYIESSIPDQELFTGFTDYQLYLNDYFEDLETLDDDLIYTVAGNVNVSIAASDGVATISSSPGWEGAELIVFSAEDYSGAVVKDSVLFEVGDAFARPNQSVVNNKGYRFTFEEEPGLQCEGVMIPHSSTNNPRGGYSIDSVGNGRLVMSSNGNQFGNDNITLGLNNDCIATSIDLSHPDQRVIEIRIQSSVNVPQFLALLTDENGITADYDVESYQLNAGEWHTLTFSFNDLRSWAGGVMDASQLETISLLFRTNFNNEPQVVAGTFIIDYIHIGSAVVPCPSIFVEPEVVFNVTDDSTTVEVMAYGQDLSYRWYRDDIELANDSKHSGVDGPLLAINSFEEENDGNYYCVFSDACGAMDDSSSAVEILAGAYYGLLTAIPAWIEAEDFDDKTNGAEIRVAQDTVVGTKIGGWHTGDWTEYEIYVPEDSYYNLQMRVASAVGTADYSLMVDGEEILRTLIPNTGGWEAWSTIEHDIELEHGEHTFRIYIHRGWFGLNWMNFRTSTFIGTNDLTTSDLRVFPNPIRDEIHFSKAVSGEFFVSDLQGRVVGRYTANGAHSIKVPGLSDGVYILSLDTGEGVRRHVRFVKKL